MPDLQPIDDAVKWVADHPAMFFSSGQFDPRLAAALVVQEALLSGASDVTVRREAEWWVIESRDDWLRPPLDSDAFQRLVPFAEGGPNGTRSEVLLTAFAADVVTASEGTASLVKGMASEMFGGRPGRVVAFRP